MSNYIQTGDLGTSYSAPLAPSGGGCSKKAGSKPCCSACGPAPALGEYQASTTTNLAVYGILGVGGLVWLMHRLGR